ncbi:glycosyltransferase family 2 protein [Mesorhizobium sp. M0589]|uniref:glycosyltransferase family 2 protein n=1 Tax=Mesorhizobium sp. M0589 TaxID=2956965 RepID=UPI0033389E94
MMRHSISVVVLNWNRQDLLDRCLQSLLSTTGEFEKCIVIDNNSSDGSVDIIRKWASVDDRIEPFLAPENRGADWINDALRMVESDLVFILANDKELMPGWREYVDAVFSAFPELGQLALHAPAPLDDEVWVTKPATYAYQNGEGLYLAHGNTGMSSIIRRDILKMENIYFENIPGNSTVKLPNDSKLSEQIKSSGYFSAWSSRYYSINVGHTLQEFERDWEYYHANYEQKYWLKLEGLKKRIDEHKRTPKPNRQSRIFGWVGQPESYGGAEESKARCWSTFGDGSLDLETLDFVYALCRLIKPHNVGVVRAGPGSVAVAAGRALQDNGFGQAVCYETEALMLERLQSRILEHSLSGHVRCASHELIENYDLLILSGYIPEELFSIEREFVLEAVARSRMLLIDASQSASSMFSAMPASDGWSTVSFPVPRSIRLMMRSL